MPKRRTRNGADRFDAEDNPIGLTGAFAPVKGPQSVDYDEQDDPVGLTQAFGAVTPDDDERPWDEAGKWKDFDWDAALGEPVGDYGAADDAADGASGESVLSAVKPQEGAGKAEGAARAASGGGAGSGARAGSADEPASAPKHASASDGAGSASASSSDSDAATPAAATAAPAQKSGPKHGRHAAPAPELSPRMRRSRRTRRVLIVLVVLLVLALAALGYFMYRTFSNSQQEAAQQAQEQVAAPKADSIDVEAKDDAADSTAKLATVPDLTKLLGAGQDDAIASLGSGALVTANHEVDEEGNPIKANISVALTDETADSRTGTPTVYLGIGEDGAVRQAGYSASASALGFGSLSFADAVTNEHVIEKTLAEAGVDIVEGSAVLPQNKDEYSTYASDGTTVVRERSSFEGDVDVAGVPCTWSAVLSYDYTTQVVTGNLSDTVRIIYVYITMK